MAIFGLPDILAFGSVSVGFNPAGYAENYDYKNGIYHVENEPGNWIQGKPGDEILVIEAVWMIDNLEGNDCPHGPYSQDSILVHQEGKQPKNLNQWTSKQIKSNTVYGYNTRYLKGPFSGKDSWQFCVCYAEFLGICFYEKCWSSWGKFDTNVEEEWVDYIYMKYTHGRAGIYKWGEDETGVYITLRESDGEPEFGRIDDYAGLVLVSKAKTKTPCGERVRLYKYNNTKEDNNPDNDGDVYHYKTDQTAAFLLLRTITCTGKPGDPC